MAIKKNKGAAVEKTKGQIEAEAKRAGVDLGDEFEELSTGLPPSWKPETEGESIIGELVARETGHDAKKNTDFTVHVVQTADGERHGLIGVQLTRALKEVPIGAKVKAIYIGTTDLDGSRGMKEYKVGFKAPAKRANA